MGGYQPLFLLLLVSLLVGLACSASSSTPPLQQKCGDEFSKLMDCIPYSTGKADSPSEKCCGSVSDIRGRDPVCLCYIIQQTHHDSPGIKELGLQFSKLVQLPSACKLPNASVKECPKLLNLKPSSPDYAIFNSSGSATSNTSSTTVIRPSSGGLMQQADYAGTIAAVTVASLMIFSVFAAAI